MSKRDDGGPAFGVADVRDSDGVGIAQGHPGMSLRDYFAIRAPEMPVLWWQDSKAEWPTKHWAEIDAEWRYFHADKMLAERNRAPTTGEGEGK